MKMIRTWYECKNCGSIQAKPLGADPEGKERAGIAFVCACCSAESELCLRHRVLTDKSEINPWDPFMSRRIEEKLEENE